MGGFNQCASPNSCFCVIKCSPTVFQSLSKVAFTQLCISVAHYCLKTVRVNLPRVGYQVVVGAHVSSDNSFLSVRQEPSFGPWKGSPFLQQYELHDEPKEYKKSGAVVDMLSEDNIWINRSTSSFFKDPIGQNFFFLRLTEQ